MRFHWQNLNDKPGGRQGSGVLQGRCWLSVSRKSTMGLEWNLWSKRFGVEIGLGDYDCALSLSCSLILLSLYWHLDNFHLEEWIKDKVKRKGREYGDGRQIGFRWFEGALSINLWNDPMEWASTDPRWWHFSIC